MTLLLAIALNAPFCPQYCINHAIQLVGKCSKEARKEHPTDDDKFMKAFNECLEEIKSDALYKRCKKVCEDKDGKESKNQG